MFEKESKEYAIGLTYPKFQDDQVANIVLRDVEGAFQKGGELGYNKGKGGNQQAIEKAVEIVRELGGIVREGVTCHYLVDYGALHRATLFLKEIKENG